MTGCQAEIRTYHLHDDKHMRYVLSHGRENVVRVDDKLLNDIIKYILLLT